MTRNPIRWALAALVLAVSLVDWHGPSIHHRENGRVSAPISIALSFD